MFLWGLIKLGIVHFTPNYALINTLQTTDEALPGREDGTYSPFPIIFPVPLPLKINWALCSSVTLRWILFSPCTPTPGRASVIDSPPPRIIQTLNRHENSIPKHIRFNFQNRLCVSYNAVAVPIIKSDPGLFLSILGTWPSPQNWEFFSHCFIQIGEKLTP